MADTIQPTPRSGALGGLADVLAWLKTQGDKLPLVDPQSWIGRNVGAGGLGSLFLGQAPEAVDRMSYGESPMHMPPAGTGGYLPDFDRTLSVDAAGNRVTGDNSRESTAGPLLDAAFAGQAGYPLAKAAGRGAARGALGMVNEAMSGAGPLAKALSPVAPAYAVKPKGGNFDASSWDHYLGTHLESDGDTPTAKWAQTQLKNYVTKQMGSPTDPLYAMQGELPDLHLPEGSARRIMDEYPMSIRKRVFEQSGEGVPVTPWDVATGLSIRDRSLGLYHNRMTDIGAPVPDWIKNSPDLNNHKVRMYGINADEAPNLGFEHVLDYLNAAQEAHTHLAGYGGAEAARANMNGMMPRPTENALALHDAGLAMSPEQVARTSVADAVRKTAAWNAHLAENQAATPDLGRGIAAVHKDYGDGMRWVKLGPQPKPYTPDSLPDGFSVKGSDGKFFIQGPDGPIRAPKFGGYADTPEEAVKGLADAHATEELSAGLNAEGKAMGHCVGGYCDDVASRGTQIYSLRDKANNPHVTVEARPGKQFENWYDKMPDDLHQARQEEFIRLHPEFADRERVNSPEWVAYLRGLPGAPKDVPDIQQIKGKQNAAPVDKYKPYVQDFVKSGQWGRVGDLQNTGLVQFKGGSTNLRDPGANFAKLLKMPEGYMTTAEASKFLQDQGAPAELADRHVGNLKGLGFKRGGSVESSSDVPKYSKKAALLARIQD